jgi:MFS family permease
MHLPPAFKHRRYFYIWLGLLISMAGSNMQLAAVHWHIRELTGEPNPLALGGIGAARFLPVVIFSLVGGAVADTLNRRKILFTTQSILAVQALILAYLTFAGNITIWSIYILTALQGAVVSFDLPARQAMVPNLVPRSDLPSAFSLSSIAFNVGSMAGPVLGSLVIREWGLEWVYFINAISFLAVIIALVLIGHVPQEKTHSNGINLSSVWDGIKFIVSRKLILSTMVMDFIATFFASANTMMPIIARDILRVGVLEYGWLNMAQSVGSVIAGLVVSQFKQIRKQGLIFLASVVTFGLATVVFGLTRSLGLALVALAIVGAADAVSTIIRNTIRQLQTPDHIRGRMTSVNQIFFMGGPQLGEVEAGVAAALFGVPFAIVSGGIGCILGMGLVAWKWPQLVAYDWHESQSAAATTD